MANSELYLSDKSIPLETNVKLKPIEVTAKRLPNEDLQLGPSVQQPTTFDFMNLVSNLGPSGVQYVQDIATPFIHPIDTARGIGTLASGYGQLAKSSLTGQEAPSNENVDAARAVNQFMSNRYGGKQQFLNTLENDPVGVLGDVSSLFTMGGGLLGKTKLASEANLVSKTGKLLDPVSLLQKGVDITAPQVASFLSQKPAEAYRVAYRAGKTGGQDLIDFNAAIGDKLPQSEIVSKYKEAEKASRNIAQDEYKKLKFGDQFDQGWADDKTRLDFGSIKNKFNDMKKGIQLRGQSTLDLLPAQQAHLDDLSNLIDTYAKKPSLHTSEGVDLFKKTVSEKLNRIDSPSAAVANIYGKTAENAYKLISSENRRYAPSMKAYENAMNTLDEIHRSIGNNEVPPASLLNKFNGLLKESGPAEYRMDLMNKLKEKTGIDIMPMIAGQALKDPLASGAAKYIAPAVAAGSGVGVHLLGGGAPLTAATIATIMAGTSPYVLGQGSKYAGKVGRYATADRVRGAGVLGNVLSKTTDQPFYGLLQEPDLSQQY